MSEKKEIIEKVLTDIVCNIQVQCWSKKEIAGGVGYFTTEIKGKEIRIYEPHSQYSPFLAIAGTTIGANGNKILDLYSRIKKHIDSEETRKYDKEILGIYNSFIS